MTDGSNPTDAPTPDSLDYQYLAHTGAEPPIVAAPDEVSPDVGGVGGATPPRGSKSHFPVPGRPGRGGALPDRPSGLGLRKFRDRLPIPSVIRAWRRPPGSVIEIRAELAAVRHHADLPSVTGWTYEGTSPGPTIEVKRDREVRIDWVNGLTTDEGPAHLPYDVVRMPSLPNVTVGNNADVRGRLVPGGRSTRRGAGSDSYPPIDNTETLTGSTVVHLHGALTDGHNDGWAHNVAGPGGVTRCTYPNKQASATLWYHDHAMAVTRFNVHAGLAGFYLIRDEVEAKLRLPSGAEEIPLAIADRNLETEPSGDPAGPKFTGRFLYKVAGFETPPGSDNRGELPVVGPFNLVNGKIWPTHRVMARWNRLRLLNASNARVLRLALHDTTDEKFEPGTSIPVTDPAFGARRLTDALIVIGTDGGLLPAPHTPPDGIVQLGPGERLDVLVDFGRFAGRTLELRNENGSALNAQPGEADASVVQFVVDPRKVHERWTLPTVLNPEYHRYVHRPDGTIEVGGEIIPEHGHHWVAVIPPGLRGNTHPEMWELGRLEDSEPTPTMDVITVTQPDGKVVRMHPVAKLFDDTTTIVIPRGQWVVWHALHLGGPQHPMHIHMTEFQMIHRRSIADSTFDLTTGVGATQAPVRDLEISPQDAGMKDTWVVNAGEWVTVLGHFEGATGSFMYHCHILDHEDATMMRPFVVLPPDLLSFHGDHGSQH